LQLQQDYPEKHFVLTDSAEEAIRLVAEGKVEVAVQNLAVATRVIRLGGLTNLKIVGITRYEFPLHFAVRKDAPELTSILNKGLATITPKEEEMIYAAHLTPDIGKARDWGAWRRRAFYTALFGAAAVGIVVLWNRYLAKEIRRRRAAEAALQEARDGLERRTQELDVRVHESERLNAELRAANHDLESFSGSVSHDLRAPLRRVISFGGLLKQSAGQCLEGENGRWMDVIISESKRMDRLINDLLQHAQFGRAELSRQRVNMGQLVRSTIEDFQPQLKERNVDWKIGDLGEVDGDPNLLHFALANLIDNALKYSRGRAQTEIKIDVITDRGPQGGADFYVRDNGCGFDMKVAGKLFSPFQRLHGGEYEGTGIGLANVERIIQPELRSRSGIS
jgi:signal transduction histidine kinase